MDFENLLSEKDIQLNSIKEEPTSSFQLDPSDFMDSLNCDGIQALGTPQPEYDKNMKESSQLCHQEYSPTSSNHSDRTSLHTPPICSPTSSVPINQPSGSHHDGDTTAPQVGGSSDYLNGAEASTEQFQSFVGSSNNHPLTPSSYYSSPFRCSATSTNGETCQPSDNKNSLIYNNSEVNLEDNHLFPSNNNNSNSMPNLAAPQPSIGINNNVLYNGYPTIPNLPNGDLNNTSSRFPHNTNNFNNKNGHALPANGKKAPYKVNGIFSKPFDYQRKDLRNVPNGYQLPPKAINREYNMPGGYHKSPDQQRRYFNPNLTNGYSRYPSQSKDYDGGILNNFQKSLEQRKDIGSMSNGYGKLPEQQHHRKDIDNIANGCLDTSDQQEKDVSCSSKSYLTPSEHQRKDLAMIPLKSPEQHGKNNNNFNRETMYPLDDKNVMSNSHYPLPFGNAATNKVANSSNHSAKQGSMCQQVFPSQNPHSQHTNSKPTDVHSYEETKGTKRIRLRSSNSTGTYFFT